MKYRDLCQNLTTETVKLLNDKRFVARSGSDHVRFERKTAYGKQVFYYSIRNLGEIYYLSIFLTSFHKNVEVAHALALGLNKKSLSIRGTFYPPSNDQSVAARTVETLDDLNRWCQDAVFYILNIGLKILESYDDIQELDMLFNDDPEEMLVGCSYLLSRAEKAIIIAKLCRNPMLPKLIDKYRAMLIEQDILLTYEDVVNFINKYQPEELQQLTM